MVKLVVVMLALGAHMAFGQLLEIKGFKINNRGLYEMSFKDARDAIQKYNHVSDANGADTVGVVYDVSKNIIDYAYFSADPDNEYNKVVSLLLYEDGKYKVMFGEFDGSEDKYFFSVIDETGDPVRLTYRKK
jgi:hypothetical protein